MKCVEVIRQEHSLAFREPRPRRRRHLVAESPRGSRESSAVVVDRPAELVGEAGIGFDEAEEVPGVLDRLRGELDERRSAIRIPALSDVADRYLEVLGG